MGFFWFYTKGSNPLISVIQLLLAGTLASNLRKEQLLFFLIYKVSLTLQNSPVEFLSFSGRKSSMYMRKKPTKSNTGRERLILHVAVAASARKCQTVSIKLSHFSLLLTLFQNLW